MKQWAMVLHFYQPPTQDPQIVKTVTETCYLPVWRAVAQSSAARLTFNVSGSLLVQLEKLGEEEALNLLKRLVGAGRVELLNSPMYHPIIPITPWEVVERQLAKNRQTIKEVLGVEAGGGVFAPELAVDEVSLDRLASLGAKYVVVDGAVVEREQSGVMIWKGMTLVVGDRRLCEVMRGYPGRLEVGQVTGMLGEGLTVSVHDGELFGHHYEERRELFEQLLMGGEVEFVNVGGVVEKGSGGRTEGVKAGSWQDVEGFGLWEGNELQKKYLQLGRLAHRAFEQEKGGVGLHIREVAEKHLDQGWSSCHLYWLSNRPWWHPELSERGANNLIKCIRSLPMDFEFKAEAERLYHELLAQMWLAHWAGKQEEGFRKHEWEREKKIKEIEKIVG